MADLVKVKTALISVSDKSNLLELAAALKDCGVQVQPVDARVLPAVVPAHPLVSELRVVKTTHSRSLLRLST